MLIPGKSIASEIKQELKEKIEDLRKKNIIPHLAIILAGNDPSSVIYVRQKEKVGKELGVKISSIKYQVSSIKKLKLERVVEKLNNDDSVHGIIIQRPIPIDIAKEDLNRLVKPEKDVDGFRPKSTFTPPIALAVIKVLNWVYRQQNNNNFQDWLKKKKILVIGRGETAGRPIVNTLIKMGLNPQDAHSKTDNLNELCLSSDIIICCVGKPNILRRDMITRKTILIGVGLHQENGKLQTDYDQQDLKEKVAYYTPVPGGVGPVNVACLFENLVSSAGKLK